jgi:orotate phosphoribosyltransferase
MSKYTLKGENTKGNPVLTEKEVRQILEGAEALLSGHFRLSSGRHSENYLQCAQVLQFPDRAERLCRALAERCRARGRIDVVASPAVGGVIIGQEVARALGVRAIFAERNAEGKLSFRRGFFVRPGERVLLADDVLTTGLSLREVAGLVRPLGAAITGYCALAERGAHDKNFDGPRDVLIKLEFQDFDPADCPACKRGLPIAKPGSRPEGVY